MNPQQADSATPVRLGSSCSEISRLHSNQGTFGNNVRIQPYDMDVLIGIPPTQACQHPGNRILQETVERYLEAYNRAKTKHDKMKINRCIMGIMRNGHKSRFLKLVEKHTGMWKLCDESSIRDKISNSLRMSGRQQQQQQQRKFKKRNLEQDSTVMTAHSDDTRKEALKDAALESAKIQKELIALHQSQKRILHGVLGFEQGKS